MPIIIKHDPMMVSANMNCPTPLTEDSKKNDAVRESGSGGCDGGGREDKVRDVENPVAVEIKNEMVTTLNAKVKVGRANWNNTFDNPT
jgi:hypothetical protein